MALALSTDESTERWSIARGALQAIPIVLCYLPVSFAIGVLAGQTHFSAGETFLLSALVFSGSGESIGLQMLALGQPLVAIWATTLIINLRYFLLSAAVIPKVAHWPRPLQYLFAFGMSDECFAMHAVQFQTFVPPPRYVLALNLTAWSSWIVGGVLGQLAGSLVRDVRPYGFDFAVPGMFIALLMMQLENRRYVGLAVLSAAMTIALKSTALSGWAILVAGITCATLGAWIETRSLERSPTHE